MRTFVDKASRWTPRLTLKRNHAGFGIRGSAVLDNIDPAPRWKQERCAIGCRQFGHEVITPGNRRTSESPVPGSKAPTKYPLSIWCILPRPEILSVKLQTRSHPDYPSELNDGVMPSAASLKEWTGDTKPIKTPSGLKRHSPKVRWCFGPLGEGE
jgi:hypothetical protein